MKRSYLSIVMIMTLWNASVHPLSIPKWGVYASTLATGIASALVVKYQWDKNELFPFLEIMGGVAITSLVWMVTDFFTPEAKYGRAVSAIEKARACPLAIPSPIEKEELDMIIADLYPISDVPLALAFREASGLFDTLTSASALLMAVREEITNKVLKESCNELITEAKGMIKRLQRVITLIRQDSRYQEQVKILEKREFAKQQLAVQHSMANAQWHAAMK